MSAIPGKIDLTPKRHHGYAVVLFIAGTLFPPLAVAARFGIGGDFWLNLLLTICGYIPGHGHNFYIQNIRNNKTHARTPKWAQRYGLVDTSEIRRKERKSQWAHRYNDRLPHSTLEDAPYAEGQEPGSSTDLSSEGIDGRPRAQATGEYWRADEETYYNANNESRSSSSRWHYPANFEDAVADGGSGGKSRKKKKSDKKDRWARTEDAYSKSERKKSKKRKSKASSLAPSSNDSVSFPEDAEGGLYGERPRPGGVDGQQQQARSGAETNDMFSHQF